ncbi:hypothetical protein TRFO_24700 [Tritrichomonas foetus]|uniref:DUF4201 domain-containing protein n=1 Tax=Tritrichomonas foetus TaxID=1144522 RepID=A0A1J4KBI9_9EUKA|nr:hypothetical protein TRFO_24700 [Tritrichomonas foetus]|eukprot:OHT07054.1 hypothetical protein TRFO_24700 [Tritrichomonas foetus]
MSHTPMNQEDQTSQFYIQQIPIIEEKIQDGLNSMNSKYQKCAKLKAKENKLNDLCFQRIKEVSMFSVNQKDYHNFKAIEELMKHRKNTAKLQNVLNSLLSLLDEKVKNGEINITIQNSFHQLKKNRENDSEWLKNNEKLLTIPINPKERSPKIVNKIIRKNSEYSSSPFMYTDSPKQTPQQKNKSPLPRAVFIFDDDGNDENNKLNQLMTPQPRKSQDFERMNIINEQSKQIRHYQQKIKTLEDKIQKMRNKILSRQKQFELSRNNQKTIDKNVSIINLIEYNDTGINCEPIANIEEMKIKINKYVSETSPQFLAFQQQQSLLNYLKQLEVELNVSNLENDRKRSEFQSVISFLKSIDPLYYTEEEKKEFSINPKLNQIKIKREKKLAAIESRIEQMKLQTEQTILRNNDISFVIDSLKKQRMRMMQTPKANVRKLCYALQSDRIIVTEHSRQLSFHKICTQFHESTLNKNQKKYSHRSMGRIQCDLDSLFQKLCSLKNRFNHLRASRENHSYVLTNEEELRFLLRKIHDLRSAIDVSNMRMNGVLSKIDKQVRLIEQKGIFLPEPPPIFISLKDGSKSKSLSPK